MIGTRRRRLRGGAILATAVAGLALPARGEAQVLNSSLTATCVGSACTTVGFTSGGAGAGGLAPPTITISPPNWPYPGPLDGGLPGPSGPGASVTLPGGLTSGGTTAPERASLALLGTGLLGIAGAIRRRRSRPGEL